MGPQLVDIDLIRDAAELIRPYAVRTPLLASPWPGLWLKPENLQPIGAFKIRGAVTAISRLDPAVRARGVLAHSSGNHAQAVAYTARAFGIDAHIVIPDNAPARKIQATRDLGATVELVPVEQRFSRPAELAEQTGKAMIPPFDHPDVISGQGTVGLEIAAGPAGRRHRAGAGVRRRADLRDRRRDHRAAAERQGDRRRTRTRRRRRRVVPGRPPDPLDTRPDRPDDGRRAAHLQRRRAALGAHPHPGARHHHRHRGRDRRRHPAAAAAGAAGGRTERRGRRGRVPAPRATGCRPGSTVAVVSGGNIDPGGASAHCWTMPDGAPWPISRSAP